MSYAEAREDRKRSRKNQRASMVIQALGMLGNVISRQVSEQRQAEQQRQLLMLQNELQSGRERAREEGVQSRFDKEQALIQQRHDDEEYRRRRTALEEARLKREEQAGIQERHKQTLAQQKELQDRAHAQQTYIEGQRRFAKQDELRAEEHRFAQKLSADEQERRSAAFLQLFGLIQRGQQFKEGQQGLDKRSAADRDARLQAAQITASGGRRNPSPTAALLAGMADPGSPEVTEALKALTELSGRGLDAHPEAIKAAAAQLEAAQRRSGYQAWERKYGGPSSPDPMAGAADGAPGSQMQMQPQPAPINSPVGIGQNLAEAYNAYMAGDNEAFQFLQQVFPGGMALPPGMQPAMQPVPPRSQFGLGTQHK